MPSLPAWSSLTQARQDNVKRGGASRLSRVPNGPDPGGFVAPSTLTPADAAAIGKSARSFIADRVIPLEQEAFVTGVDDKLLVHLQQLAHDADLLGAAGPGGER